MDESNDYFEKMKIFKWSENGLLEQVRPVIREVPLTIYLNDHEIVTLLCLGDHLKSLAIGFLKSEGLITRLEDLKSVSVDESDRLVRVEVAEDTALVEKLYSRRTITSGCGKGTTFYNALDALIMDKINSSLTIRTDQVFHLMRRLGEDSELYKITGGTHNSALATVDDLILFRTDIGRHNAVDKIYGESFLENIFLQDKVLVTTGRMTSEILIKTARMGIPILISRSTATSLAVNLAEQVGVTLIGYVRGNNQIVYTGRNRVVFDGRKR
ncbi:MAG TPA: formate dehydrogenase accessory sulfurtransferase FdhD [Thermodesulfobacteriota bacterium]|nr:formate dehydrogenase accessory sulfurtransferase FdhD [Thermodesulfobacteriota bacterium]